MASQHQHKRWLWRVVAANIMVAACGLAVATAQDAPEASATPAASSAVASPATNGAPAAASGTQDKTIESDLSNLERFLSLPPDRLKQLRSTIDYLDNMTQAQRDALLRDVQARQNSITQLRAVMRTDVQQLSQSDQIILGAYERTLFAEDLQALITRFENAGQNTDARKQIIQDMLKAAAAKGIHAPAAGTDRQPSVNRGNTPPGGRGRPQTDGSRSGNRITPQGTSSPTSSSASN